MSGEKPTEEMTIEELEAQEGLELPVREVLSLVDPGLLGGTGGDALVGADYSTTDSTKLADQRATSTSQLVSEQATEAASTETDPSQPYDPHVTSRAES